MQTFISPHSCRKRSLPNLFLLHSPVPETSHFYVVSTQPSEPRSATRHDHSFSSLLRVRNDRDAIFPIGRRRGWTTNDATPFFSPFFRCQKSPFSFLLSPDFPFPLLSLSRGRGRRRIVTCPFFSKGWTDEAKRNLAKMR